MYQHLINYLILFRQPQETAQSCFQRFMDQLKSRAGQKLIDRRNCKNKEERIEAANRDRFLGEWIEKLEKDRKSIERCVDKKF